MKKRRISYLSILFILALLGILYIYLFKGTIGGTEYGEKANVIRERLKIPIIESNMKRVRVPNNVEGGRWESKDYKSDFIHLWKIVSPYNGNYLLNEESDLFKKNEDNGVYWQLNIYSKILGDSVSVRNGILSLQCAGCNNSRRNLDENGLDSIFIVWGLKSLIKKDFVQ